MIYPHIKALLFNRPLLVSQSRLDLILEGLAPRLFFGIKLDTDNAEAVDTFGIDPVPAGVGTVAIIPVHGTLTNRDMGMNARSEPLMSYTEIGNRFESAMNDPQVAHVVLDVDSPGGEAAGAMDLSDQIFEARDRKPITAIIDERGLSAAYAIASGASRVVMSRTAEAGSIGVVAAHLDQSRADANEGVKYTYVYAGKHKIDYSGHRPLSDSARTELQVEVDQLYSLFVDTVARNRGLSAEHIMSTEAKVLVGQAALDAGLVDAIEPARFALGSVFQSTANEVPIMAKNAAKISAEFPPSVQTDATPNMVITTTTDTATPLSSESVTVTTLAPAGEPTEPTEPSITIADAQAIIDACNAAGLAAIAGQCIAADMGLEAVKARIEEAKQIQKACASALAPDQAEALLLAGVDLNGAKAHLFDSIIAEGSAFRKAESTASKAAFFQDLVTHDENNPTGAAILPTAGLEGDNDPKTIQSNWDAAYRAAGVK